MIEPTREPQKSCQLKPISRILDFGVFNYILKRFQYSNPVLLCLPGKVFLCSIYFVHWETGMTFEAL